jgi:hypothetical protein
VVKDVIASYKTLVDLFERTQFFLQRLNQYTTVPLTREPIHNSPTHARDDQVACKDSGTSSLGSGIFDQGHEGEANQCVYSIQMLLSLLTDYCTEKFMKRLLGKTDVEDALQRLDMLTKEENLMMAARTLEVVHAIRDDVDVIKEDTRDIEDNLKETEHRVPHPF